MGKSPGKWIKTVILGKKHSKSSLSKGAEMENDAVLQLPDENLHLNHSFVEEAPNQSNDKVGAEAKLENGTPGSVSCEPVKELTDLHGVAGLNSADDDEAARLQQATIIIQAACRGYLARRAFWALKGIIRLQALIRGHLVRKQAVATLHCLYCIVRFQALARGRRVRILYPGLELSRKSRVQEVQDTAFLASVGTTAAFRSQKLSTNGFASKLLSLAPKAKALSLQYGPEEPNSAWMWLKRWSLLRFWVPLVAPPKAISNVKSQAKLVSKGKSRRTFRKVANAVAGENAGLDKPRRNPRTLASHQTESHQEQQQCDEPEKANRNLKKETSVATVVSAEKPLQTQGKSSNGDTADLSEPGIINLPEQQSESNYVVDELAQSEKISDSLNTDDPFVPALHPDDLVNEQKSLENEIHATINESSIPKEDHVKRESQKTRRRKSVPGKQECYRENVSQNTASVPSYMAATESAKAKLRRMQGSVKSSEDDGDKNGFVRRHSLPISAKNSKPSTLSPRLQKPAQTNGKEERVLQPGWKR